VQLIGGLFAETSQFDAIVGHSGSRGLFILCYDTRQETSAIYRFHAVSGQYERNWSLSTKDCAYALKVASNDLLLVTSPDCIEEFDTDGHRIRVVQIDTNLRECRNAFQTSLLMSDSMYRHYTFS